MSIRLQIIIIICMFFAMAYIINLMQKKKMDFKFALGWLLVEFCIVILTLWPNLLNILSNLLGIASPMNMLFFFGFCFAVIIIFALSLEISKLSDRVKKLSQEIAIIRKDMYDNDQRLQCQISEKQSENIK